MAVSYVADGDVQTGGSSLTVNQAGYGLVDDLLVMFVYHKANTNTPDHANWTLYQGWQTDSGYLGLYLRWVTSEGYVGNAGFTSLTSSSAGSMALFRGVNKTASWADSFVADSGGNRFKATVYASEDLTPGVDYAAGGYWARAADDGKAVVLVQATQNDVTCANWAVLTTSGSQWTTAAEAADGYTTTGTDCGLGWAYTVSSGSGNISGSTLELTEQSAGTSLSVSLMFVLNPASTGGATVNATTISTSAATPPPTSVSAAATAAISNAVALSALPQSPTLGIGTTVTIAQPVAIAAAPQAPTPHAAANVTPTAIGISALPQAPTTRIHVGLTASVIPISAQPQAPTAIVAGQGATVSPDLIPASSATPPPTAGAGHTVTLASPLGALADVPTPTVDAATGATVEAVSIALAADVPTVTVEAGVGTEATPLVVACTTTVPTPTVSDGAGGDVTVTLTDPVAIAVTTPAPTPDVITVVDAAVIAVEATCIAPAEITADISAEVTPVVIALSIYSDFPTLSVGANATPSLTTVAAVVGTAVASVSGYLARIIFCGDAQLTSGQGNNEADSASDMAYDEQGVDIILTSGDHTENGRTDATEYSTYYTPTWGRTGLKAIHRVAVGNHDWNSTNQNAANMTNYFADTNITGSDPNHYWSFDLGGWHIIILNSQLSMASGSAQYNWLSSDLSSNSEKPTILCWHNPYLAMHDENGASSTYAYPGEEGGINAYDVWDLCYHQTNRQVEFICGGHTHVVGRSKRVEPLGRQTAGQAPNVQVDATYGIRQFIGSIAGEGGYVATDPDGVWDLVGNGAGGIYASSNLNTGYWRIDLYQDRYEWTLRLDNDYGNYTTSTLSDTGSQTIRMSLSGDKEVVATTIACTSTLPPPTAFDGVWHVNPLTIACAATVLAPTVKWSRTIVAYGTTAMQYYDSGGGTTPVSMPSDNTWSSPTNGYGAPTRNVGDAYDAGGAASNPCTARNDTYWLIIKGFDLSSIPDWATVTAFTTTCRYAYNTTAGAYGNRLHVGIDNSSQIAVSGANITTEATTYADATLTASPTVAQLKDTNFAVGIGAKRTSTTAMTVYVDSVWFSVTFESAGVVRPTPDTIACAASVGTPTVDAGGGSATVSAVVIGITATPLAATITADVTVAPADAIAVVVATPDASLIAGTGATVAASAIDLSASPGVPTVAAYTTAEALELAVSSASDVPTVTAGADVAAASVDLVAVLETPTVVAALTVYVDAILTSASLSDAVVAAGAYLEFNTIQLPADMLAPTVDAGTGASVAPDVIVCAAVSGGHTVWASYVLTITDPIATLSAVGEATVGSGVAVAAESILVDTEVYLPSLQVGGGVTINASVVPVAAYVLSAAAGAGHGLTAVVIAVSSDVVSLELTVGANAVPITAEASGLVLAPTVTAGGEAIVLASTIVVASTTPDVTVSGSTNITGIAIASLAATPPAVTSINVEYTSEVIAVAASLADAVVHAYAAAVQLDAIQTWAGVLAPSVAAGGSATVSAEIIPIYVGLPAPTVTVPTLVVAELISVSAVTPSAATSASVHVSMLVVASSAAMAAPDVMTHEAVAPDVIVVDAMMVPGVNVIAGANVVMQAVAVVVAMLTARARAGGMGWHTPVYATVVIGPGSVIVSGSPYTATLISDGGSAEVL